MEFKQIGNTNYSINKLGEVRNDKRGTPLQCTCNGSGYRRVSLNGKKQYVHRLVAATFLRKPYGKSREDMQVNHINSDRSDNRVDNLEYVTASENTKLQNKNRKGNKYKQYDSIVAKILLEEGKISLNAISQMSGVPRTTLAYWRKSGK